MKRLLFAAIIIFSSVFANAQTKLAVSYPDFESWAKQIKIPGYPFLEGEKDGADYAAMLGSGPTKVLQLRMTAINRFDEYKMTNKQAIPYTWNGYKAVNYFFADVTFLTLALPKAGVAVTFGMSGKATKAAMEGLAAKSNLQNLKVKK